MVIEPQVHVVGLWRHPVKSLGGERLDAVAVGAEGLEGDRAWALVDDDGLVASGKTTQRFRKVEGLLAHAARLHDGEALVTLADGRELPGAAAAREIAGLGWRLAHAGDGRFQDEAPVHLASVATLAALGVEPERLRVNVLLDLGDEAYAEDALIGTELTLGEVVLHVTHATERCVMTNHARPGLGIPHDPSVLKRIGRLHRAHAGVHAQVVRPGTLRVGRA